MGGGPSDVASLVELLESRAEGSPCAPAYTFRPDRGPSLASTWAELWAAAGRVAAEVAARVGPGERVLLLEPPSLDFIAAFFGLLRAGVVPVPLAPPRSPRNAERLARVLEVARPALAWAPPAVASRLRDAPGWSGVRFAHRGDAGSDGPVHRPGPEDVAFLQFTSGSTGAPKGVVLPHRALLHNLEQMRVAFELDAGFVCVGWLPLQHDMGLIGNVLAPLYMGAPCTLMAPESFLMKPIRWLEAISETRATVSGGPDFAYALVAGRLEDAELEGLDLSSWRVAFSGAEPVRAATLEHFSRRLAPAGFRRSAFFPCYGLAEATLLVASAPVAAEPAAPAFDPGALEAGRLELAGEGAGRRLVAHGGPHLDQRLLVVDPEREVPVPEGRIGEIWVQGPSVAAGYFGEPEGESAGTSFGRRLPDAPGLWLRTRDLGGFFQGQLYVAGRVADLLIIGGRNVFPQDVERAVEAAHDDLGEGGSIAFSVDDGARERLVVAAEVRRPAVRRVEPEAVARAARAALFAGEGLALDELVLLRPGALPRTTSGKPRRAACKAAYREGTLMRLERRERAEETT